MTPGKIIARKAGPVAWGDDNMNAPLANTPRNAGALMNASSFQCSAARVALVDGSRAAQRSCTRMDANQTAQSRKCAEWVTADWAWLNRSGCWLVS